MFRSVLKALLPILVLLAGAGATAALISSRKAPERAPRPALGPLVEVQRVETTSVTVEVDGQGEVHPQVRVDLAPQVTGRVIRVHPSLVTGGRFRAGATLVEIDPRDYELAVERARASVVAAETVLLREEAEGAAAREEWRAVHPSPPGSPGASETPPSLLVREPQIREAEARIAAARADQAAAELSLERTRLSLPFDGLVIDENVDVGQLVASGQKMATVYGTKSVEVRVPLDDRELAWFDLPGRGAKNGTPATVSADFAGARRTWHGRVDRLEGQVDTRSRMVNVVVVVKDPFAGSVGDEGSPLLPGTFVDVAIVGRRLENVVIIPRHALRENRQVWVVRGTTLEIRDVEVVRQDQDKTYIHQGLEAGDLVVVSSLDAATDGMTVRTGEVNNV